MHMYYRAKVSLVLVLATIVVNAGALVSKHPHPHPAEPPAPTPSIDDGIEWGVRTFVALIASALVSAKIELIIRFRFDLKMISLANTLNTFFFAGLCPKHVRWCRWWRNLSPNLQHYPRIEY